MYQARLAFLALLALAVATGVHAAAAEDTAAPPPAGAAHADAPGIAWFSGSVEQAFAAAKVQNRPVFLYWGASWCPPCQQLKATVFTRPDFIRTTQLFVPVYLDGDDPGAQKWGETFKVVGYPTLVVLNAQRAEIARIAGSMDLSQFASVLDSALGALQPVNKLLTDAARRPLNLSECRRLAFNGWILEPPDVVASARLPRQLSGAATHCPAEAKAERARLQVIAAYFATEDAAHEAAGTPLSAALKARIGAVLTILAQPKLADSVADVLQWLGEPFFHALAVEKPPLVPTVLAEYSAAMDSNADDSRYAAADQLGAVASKLEAIKTLGPGGTIPKPEIAAANARIDAALAANQLPYLRSGIINSALHIYDEADEDELGYTLLKGELDHTATPYYYEADLADLCEALGRKDEAVSWLARAYRESKGTATRFQWGALYASGLIRMQPDGADEIASVTGQVLDELGGPDRIYQRARLRLDKLDKDLQAWNDAAKGAHQDVLRTLRGRMQQICGKIPATEPARQSCDAFLAHA
ncbi:MAG TPA: thioredoxin family protein [Steroidobacteraceae bacterium]